MLSWLKHHLIPHKGNGHRPRLLHNDTARAIVLAVLFLEVAVFFSSIAVIKRGGSFMASVFPAVLGDLTNIEREELALADLTPSPILAEAALLKVQDMASRGYFAHTSPEGKTPWFWLDQVGYDYEYAGENLAVNFTDSADVTAAWMNSPTHRANIAKAAYTEVGTGVATGTYEGRETIFVAQLYGKPAPKSVVSAASIVSTTALSEASPTAPTAIGSVNPLPQVLGAEVGDTSRVERGSTFWQRLASSPRHTMNYVLYAVALLVGSVLALKLVINMRAHHVDLVVNGLLVITIVFGVYLANSFVSQRNTGLAPAAIFQAFDGANPTR